MKRDLLIILGAALVFGVSIAYHLHAQAMERAKIAKQRAQRESIQLYDPMQQNCPVCGEDVRERDYSADFEYEGETYTIFFDKEECKSKFIENPEEYLEDYEKATSQQGGPGMMGPGGPGGPGGRGGGRRGPGGQSGGEGSGGQNVTPPEGAGQSEGSESE